MYKIANKRSGSSKKEAYRVTNWREYDRALVERGNITFWFDKEAMEKNWRPAPTGKRGAPWLYSDWAIQTLLMLKGVFHLPYRSLEGFGRSLMCLMGLERQVPDHSHMSRRAKTLQIQIPRRERTEPIHVVVDSTGMKIMGEGEWKVEKYGVSQRRTWLKVHLALDAHQKDVIGLAVTTVKWSDSQVFGELIEQIEGNIEQIDADGSYDAWKTYDIATKRKAKLIVPPRKNAIPWQNAHPRTQTLLEIQKNGLSRWKKTSGYHRRSLVENAMYRFKQLFGNRVASRVFESQVNEVHARIASMNKLTYLGMPVSVRLNAIAA